MRMLSSHGDAATVQLEASEIRFLRAACRYALEYLGRWPTRSAESELQTTWQVHLSDVEDLLDRLEDLEFDEYVELSRTDTRVAVGMTADLLYRYLGTVTEREFEREIGLGRSVARTLEPQLRALRESLG